MALEYVVNIKDDGSATIKKISGEAEKLRGSLANVDKATGSFNKSLGFLKTTGAGLASILGAQMVSYLKDTAKAMVDNYDSAAKLSENIGVASDSIIGLRHAAELSGVGAEEMDKNLAKLSKTIGEAAGGSKQAGAAFAKLGVDVKNSDGSVKNSEKVLMELADKFKDLPAGAERATLAMDLFGKTGANMVSVLKDGSSGLKEMVDQGKAAAGDVEGISEAMQKLNDAGTKAKAALTGIIAALANNAVFQSAIDMVNDLSNAFIKWQATSRNEKEKEKTQNVKDLSEAYKEYQMQLAAVAQAEFALGVAKDNNLKSTAKEKQAELAAAQKKLDELNSNAIKLEINANAKKIDQIDLEQAKLQGLQQAYSEIKKEGSSSSKETLRDLKSEIEMTQSYIDKLKTESETIKANKMAAANAISGSDAKNKATEEAKKKYADESKRLDEWLAKYKHSKLTENQLAEEAYANDIKEFDALLARKKISKAQYDEYVKTADDDLKAKLKEIDDKKNEERIKSEETLQGRILELRKISAKSNGEIAEIEIQQISIKYDTELKKAAENAELVKEIERAKETEIAAVNERTRQNEIAQAELIRGYRETAASTDAERMALQMEAIDAKYAMELEKAKNNSEMIVEIERAKNAEIARLQEQHKQMQLAQAQQVTDSAFQIMEAIAVYGKAGGNTMKALAIAQATINTSLAATKAATSAPWPLNALLVAGALAQGATQIANIKAQKFYGGGMIPGRNTLVMANEEGREAILNTRAVRAVGGEAGVNALNRGASISNSYDNRNTSTIVINTSIMTQKAYKDEIEPVLRRAERRR